MKKLFALILTVCLLASMSTTAFAANTTGGETEISFNVDPTYTVTIPATVSLGNEITVSAENVRVNKGSQVVVSMEDVNGNAFTMTSTEGYTFVYSVTANGTAVSSGANVLTVNPDTAHEGNVTLKFEKPGQAIYAGNYSGQVTFTVAVQAAVDP